MNIVRSRLLTSLLAVGVSTAACGPRTTTDVDAAPDGTGPTPDAVANDAVTLDAVSDTSPAASFELALPASTWLPPGGATLVVRVTRRGGFTGALTATLEGAPGVVATPTQIAPSAEMATIALTPSAELRPGAVLDARVRVVASEAGVAEQQGMTAIRVQGRPGTLDETFGMQGRLVTPAGTMALGSEGRRGAVHNSAMLVAGRHDGRAAVWRVTERGELDGAFAMGGRFALPQDNSAANTLFVRGEQVYVAGVASSESMLARLTRDGALDTTFGTAAMGGARRGWHQYRHAAGQPEGVAAMLEVAPSGPDLILAGTVQAAMGQPRVALRRVGGDGTEVTSFGTNGVAFAPFAENLAAQGRAVVVDSSGRLLTAGYVAQTPMAPFPTNAALARFEWSGQVDTTYNTTGGRLQSFTPMPTANVGIESVAVDRDGAVYAAGSYFDTQDRALVMRFRGSDGALDTTFGANGFVSVRSCPRRADNPSGGLRGIVVRPTGGVVAVGYCGPFISNGVPSQLIVIGLTARGELDAAFGRMNTAGIFQFAEGEVGAQSDAAHVFYDQVGRLVVVGRSSPMTGAAGSLLVARFWP